MRTEAEMFALILSFAQVDERIRLVTLEGSRTNVNISKDIYQDYDITFLVTEIDSFKKSDQWLDIFGERVIMQKPEAMELYPPTWESWFSYLIQFEDGIKMDLTLVPIAELSDYLDQSDGLLALLLDKDKHITSPLVATDQQYHLQKPSERMFDDCCNEYWWLTLYVAKGLCRGEILFANFHFNDLMRSVLMQMVGWNVGIETAFALSVGKNGKFLQRYLSAERWQKLLATFDSVSYQQAWQSLFLMNDLFSEISQSVAQKLHFAYPDYDEKVSRSLRNFHQDYLATKEKE